MLIKLEIPPGLYKNGTEYQAAGRWTDANLVRWFENTLRPIGGWQTISSAQFNDVARGMHGYFDNTNNRRVIVGTTSNLYVYAEGTSQSNITPSGIVTGRNDAASQIGYGAQLYGEHAYGVARPDNEQYDPVTTWTIDNFGEDAVCSATTDGKIYIWENNPSAIATVLTNAPTSNQGVLVTDERFVMCLGAGGNPRKVQWSSQEAATVWTPASTNSAGSLEVASDGKIRAGIVVRGQVLILTDTSAHALSFVGTPFYYVQETAGSNCGIISAKAVAVTGTAAFWMGEKSFFRYDGGYTVPIRSDVSDFVFNRINQTQRSKIWAVINGQYNECWWFYPSTASTEIDSYVAYNFADDTWTVGTLARTAGIDAGIFIDPIWASTDRYLYEHESGFAYDSATPFAESGAIEIGVGERLTDVTELIPDESNLGDTSVIFKTRNFPTATETTSSSISMANPTSVRLTARQVRIRVSGNTAADWRYGNLRLNGQAGSRR